MSKHKFYWIQKHLALIIVGIVSIIIIGCLRFTEVRPFGFVKYSKNINYVIETLSFSIVSAIIFFICNDIYAHRHKYKVARSHICRQLHSIVADLKMLINSIEPFKLEDKNYSEEEFVAIFSNKNLYESYYGSPQKILDAFNDKIDRIISKVESLLSSYSEYMTISELKYLQFIMESYIVNNNIKPIDFSISPRDRFFFDENQEYIGRSLYQLYNLSKRRGLNP